MTTSAIQDRFGAFGGRYVPETLIPALDELERAFERAKADPSFEQEIAELHRTYVGRPSPLSEARQAHELIENRAQFGKIVLRPD